LLLSNRQQSILQPFLESCLLVDNFVQYGLPLMLVDSSLKAAMSFLPVKYNTHCGRGQGPLEPGYNAILPNWTHVQGVRQHRGRWSRANKDQTLLLRHHGWMVWKGKDM